MVCPACGHAVSITSGTLLHGTKKNLSLWLRAIWFICNEEKKVCVRKLQHTLEMKNYQTAWSWMQKLRLAINMANSQKCSGNVEIADIQVTDKTKTNICHILVALEITIRSKSTGRVRMGFCNKLTQEHIQLFIRACITEGSILLLPDTAPYNIDLAPDFLCISEPRQLFQENTNEIFNRFIKTYYDHTSVTISSKRLENNLAEFCFYQNKNLFPDTIGVFNNFVAMVLDHKPLHNDSLSESSEPDSGVT